MFLDCICVDSYITTREERLLNKLIKIKKRKRVAISTFVKEQG